MSLFAAALLLSMPQVQSLPHYPWEERTKEQITKYHFRCKGRWENPFKAVEIQGKKNYIADCSGVDGHSLPLREGREFIYPILIDLLNHIQRCYGHNLIITSGHRCPEHNAYVEQSDPYSKHLLGAAVTFYGSEREITPSELLSWVDEFYQRDCLKCDKSEFTHFQRYQKGDTFTKTEPWYNKEIFIKFFLPHEGRNGDNNHTFAYYSIQVRWDRSTNERVSYSHKQAYENFLRY